MVGQALALKLDNERRPTISPDRLVTVAITHYIKFLDLHITSDFIPKFETLPTAQNMSAPCFLIAKPTIWFDVKEPGHRKDIVGYILAMMAWANSSYSIADTDMGE
ncbi:hypothetical protein HIM_05702 [Hirsutella minnesotensis 3608]|uniref:Uncharacterized protein n=1 Tax=Hirsutella minnesotensis 3608 TaxID=1043627 RepID=A0A0F7ZK47_9HYPO|nr:hypothetical protein HIM_05702 [Hirsutella minnesotensis 3608]